MFTFFQEPMLRTLGNDTRKIKELISQKSKPKYGENEKKPKKKQLRGRQENTDNFWSNNFC